MSSSGEDDNILICGKAPTEGLNDTTLTAEKEYPIKFEWATG